MAGVHSLAADARPRLETLQAFQGRPRRGNREAASWQAADSSVHTQTERSASTAVRGCHCVMLLRRFPPYARDNCGLEPGLSSLHGRNSAKGAQRLSRISGILRSGIWGQVLRDHSARPLAETARRLAGSLQAGASGKLWKTAMQGGGSQQPRERPSACADRFGADAAERRFKGAGVFEGYGQPVRGGRCDPGTWIRPADGFGQGMPAGVSYPP